MREAGHGPVPVDVPCGLVTDGGLPPSNSFVLMRHRMVYISVTKAACTSLRWMMARLGGEDPERFYNGTGPHLTRLMTVHGHRSKWSHVRRLSDMDPAEVAQISPANGWFVFAVVRDPWSRLWSAWQSKFLVRHPTFAMRYGDEPWFPRIPRSPDDAVEDFRAFVQAHPWTDHPDLMRDSHFWPQVRAVRPDGLDYSRVHDLAALPELVSDIHAHLDGLGLDEELYLPRANETPLALTDAVLAGGVAERIEELYGADFARFGDRWDRSAVKVSPAWSDDAIRAVGFHAAVFERIGDMSRENERLRLELRRTRRRLPAAEAAEARPPLRLALSGLPARVRRVAGR